MTCQATGCLRAAGALIIRARSTVGYYTLIIIRKPQNIVYRIYLGPFNPLYGDPVSASQNMCPQGRTASASPASKSLARESLHSICHADFSNISQGQLDSEVDRQAAERQHTQLSPPLSAATRQLPAGPRHSNRAFPPDRAPSMRKRRRSCQLQKHSNTMPVCSRVYEARVLLDRPWLLKSHQECGVALAVSRTSPFPVHLRLALGGCVQTGRAGPITLVQGFVFFGRFLALESRV